MTELDDTEAMIFQHEIQAEVATFFLVHGSAGDVSHIHSATCQINISSLCSFPCNVSIAACPSSARYSHNDLSFIRLYHTSRHQARHNHTLQSFLEKLILCPFRTCSHSLSTHSKIVMRPPTPDIKPLCSFCLPIRIHRINRRFIRRRIAHNNGQKNCDLRSPLRGHRNRQTSEV